ncbi:MAG: TonB-dependent receptor [Gammaproteobacteria bacterium]
MILKQHQQAETRASRRMSVAHIVGLVLAAAAATSAFAQEAPVEEVTVTGSRIRQNPLEARSPVQVLSSEDIERSGFVGLGDYLQSLPIAGSSINRTNNAAGNLGFPPDGSGTSTGASEIDLRYLGAKRTLVLVDGRRWVHGSSASGVSGAVDLNTIPAAAIESIEILQDGASTIYGSDAIAGVINVITKRNYEDKATLTGYYGGYTEGDGQSTRVDLSWGTHGEKSRVFFSASYDEQKAIYAGDRAISEFPIPGLALGLSSGSPQGGFFFTDPRIPDPNGEGANYVGITLNNGATNTGQTGHLPAYSAANPCGGDFHCFELSDRYNWQPANLLGTPVKRINAFTKAEFDVADTVTMHTSASFSNRTSTAVAAPEPLFFGPGGASGIWMENVVIPANQLYNPFGIRLDSSNIDTLARRPVEAGPRIFEQTVNTLNVSAGFDGHFSAGQREWFWDVTGSWFRNDGNQRKTGDFNARNLSVALGDPAVCAATFGCVPFNLFGGVGSITPAMLDYVTYTEKDESTQSLADITANITGHLFELPAGEVGVAVGVERRKESGRFTPDSVVVRGESADPPTSPTDGSFDVTEYYGEVVVPLLKGIPGAERLDLSGAVRASDYSLFSTTTVFKAGLTWAPVKSLVVRGSYSEGFRAPNIGELFNSGSRFDAAISDPCSGATGTLAANCTRLGVPANFTASSSQVGLTTGGNPNLQPEKAKTTTAGFTFSANEFADKIGLSTAVFEVNYYDIKLDRAIEAPDATAILTTCVTTLNPFYCDSISRATTGDILRIDTVLDNIAGIDTNGIDWSISGATQPTAFGQFRFSWQNTHLLKYVEKTPGPSGTIVSTERAGTELGVAGAGFPKWKSTLTLGWQYQDWGVQLTSRYIDSITESCGGLTASFAFVGFSSPPGPLGFCTNGATAASYYATGNPGTNKIKSEIYTDLSLSWSPEVHNMPTKLQLGVQNVLDRETPVCRSCTINGFDGTLYPIPGRFVFGRVGVQF